MVVDPEARKAQTQATFDRIAPEYDVAGPGCFAHFGRRLVEAVGISPGQRVLDVATGRGAVLMAAAEHLSGTGQAIGIDFSAGMLQAASTEVESRGLGALVEVRQMDAEHLDFPDASFERVLCGFGLMFFPHLDRALAEFRRVLAPDGRLGVSTWRRSQSEDLDLLLDEELALGGPRQPGWITEPDELAQLLEQAGFGQVQTRIDEITFGYADIDAYWQNARGTGTRRRLDALSSEDAARVREAFAARVRPPLREDGLHLPASALIGVARR